MICGFCAFLGSLMMKYGVWGFTKVPACGTTKVRVHHTHDGKIQYNIGQK